MPDILDAHVHVGQWRDPSYEGRCVSFQETVDELMRSGVRAAFLFPTDGKENSRLLADIKKFRARGEKFRAHFFPWVDLQRDDFTNFLQTEKEWVSGLKFHPSFDRRPVTDPAYTPAFEFARASRLPVVIHCGRWQEISGYELALERARTMPELTFVLSHMGGDRPELQRGAVRAVKEMRLGNVLFGTESVREYWSLTSGIMELGAERFLFGSDFSLGHPAIYLAVLGLCTISEGERSKILGGNAMELIRA
jgi:predicted TIM-barrel fold metal-dependent hydrolase